MAERNAKIRTFTKVLSSLIVIAWLTGCTSNSKGEGDLFTLPFPQAGVQASVVRNIVQLHPGYSAGAAATHELSYSVVRLSNSHWRYEDVLKMIETTALAFESCRIRIKEVNLLLSENGVRWPAISESVDGELGNDRDLAAHYADLPRPIVFYTEAVESTIHAATSRPAAAGFIDSFVDTAYMFGQVAYSQRESYQSSCHDCWYGLEAHELTHNLANFADHVDEPPNVLGAHYLGKMALRLTNENCLSAYNHPAIHPIGSRRVLSR